MIGNPDIRLELRYHTLRCPNDDKGVTEQNSIELLRRLADLRSDNLGLNNCLVVAKHPDRHVGESKAAQRFELRSGNAFSLFDVRFCHESMKRMIFTAKIVAH